MVTAAQILSNHNLRISGRAVGMATVGVLVALIALLTMSLMKNPFPSQDLEVFHWITGLDVAGIASFFKVVSLMTDSRVALVYGIAILAILIYLKQWKLALIFGAVAAVGAVGAIASDYTLGELVGRTRPFNDASDISYPSGHVFGTTVFFGFLGFLGIQLKARRRYLVPLLIAVTGIILAVGPSRIYEQAHWPSDVAAGYLLGTLWLVIMIPPIRRFMKKSDSHADEDVPASGKNGIRIANSMVA